MVRLPRAVGWHATALAALVTAAISSMGYISCSQSSSSPALRNLLTRDERRIFLGSQDSESSHEIVDAFITRRTTRNRRSKEMKLRRKDADEEEMTVKMSALGEKFHLRVRKNSQLLDPHIQGLEGLGNGSRDCLYHGYSVHHPDSSVALSLCDDGIHGFVQTPSHSFSIHPLPDHVTQQLQRRTGSRPHLVVRREISPNMFCPHALRRKHHWSMQQTSKEEPRQTRSSEDGKEEDDATRSRHKRATTGQAVIETAVFIDQALYDQMKRTFPTDTDRQLTTFVLTMMNAVQRLFQHSSLGRSPDVRLVLMETLKTQPQELQPSDNIDTYLTNFCIWQHNRRHYGRGKTPRWDHALLLSGINMYVVDESGRRKRHVVGLAPVSGMCNPLNSCTISEGTSFQTVLVAAHEMGHSLGMEHDGHQDGNHCDSDTYIMSPTLGAGKTTWSTCSRQYLEKFLRSHQSNCLQSPSPYTTDLLEPPPDKPPGQVYDADYQCALRYGDGSRRSSLQTSEEICRMLRCDTGYGSKGVSFAAHPALEGTNCGRDKWCQGGSCVPVQRSAGTLRGRVVDGAWSSWSPYSPCSSDCVPRGSSAAVGVMVSTRRCDSPRPMNGGRFCLGKERRVLICDATRICSVSSRRLMLDEYISDTCRQASARDNTLENTGTQFPSQESKWSNARQRRDTLANVVVNNSTERDSHSCYVWCHKRGGGYMTQGWTIPDGTPCWRGFHPQSMYCVKGECQAFDCNGYSTDSPNDLRCSSSSSGASPLSPGSPPPLAEVVWGPWHKVSQCRPSCLLNGKGFQLVTRECNAVTGCAGQRDTFQLCDAPLSSCGSLKTVDQYAAEVCQRYRVKYPTVLSGKGRQLPPQPGNSHSACIVACQDRVWQDTHYQMDVYEDGKFPFGTDCSPDHRTKAYCLNGRCLQFDEEGTPKSPETGHMYEVRRYLSHIRRRDTSGANHVFNSIDDTLLTTFKKWLPETKEFLKQHWKKNKKKPTDWVAKLDYGWAVEMSECSAACGGGVKNITVVCQTGDTVVDDGFCAGINKPGQTGIWPCNTRPCTGRWQEGAWSPCSVSCGEGVQTRDVLCLQQVSTNIFSMVEEKFCPGPFPSIIQTCSGPPCHQSRNSLQNSDLV